VLKQVSVFFPPFFWICFMGDWSFSLWVA
jgi:hypothetical protein